MAHLDGSGGDLEVVQFAQCALSVYEVGGSQLVERLQSHSRAVRVGQVCCPAQPPLVYKYS